MGLIDRLSLFLRPVRYMDPYGFVNFNGTAYPLTGLSTSMPGSKQEDIDPSFTGFANQAYRGNSIVFAVMYARQRLFTEARFQWRRMSSGRPGDLFGTADLDILEHPWPNGTTGDLLARMIQDADLAGNFYGVRSGKRIHRLQPDWVSIILDRPQEDPEATIAGYKYQPGGKAQRGDPTYYDANLVCHFAPIPDPFARFRGMSWLTPLIREIQADGAATAHKLNFFEQGATPNLVIKRDTTGLTKDKWNEWVAMMRAGHEGSANAYKTLFLSDGADATVIGTNLRQMDFKQTQGAGETRIAAAGATPPIIVGLSEGLQAATYSNYGQARRAFGDLFARPTWRNAAGSLQTIVPAPPGAELWYDDRDIPFLSEDRKDAIDIEHQKASTVAIYVTAGFKPKDVIKAVAAGDMSLLENAHTGLTSVQLVPPKTAEDVALEKAKAQALLNPQNPAPAPGNPPPLPPGKGKPNGKAPPVGGAPA